MTDQIERELELPGSPSDLWPAFTESTYLELWLADEVLIELAPGGEARFRTGGETRVGWVEEVSPPSPERENGSEGVGRLAFWWSLESAPASRVEIELTPVAGGGTRVRIVEARPLEVLDLTGLPLPGPGGERYGPALLVSA